MQRQPSEVPRTMGREEFRRWAEAQLRGRYERVDGEVVAMAPERVEHARIKAAVWLALRNAIATAGLPCEALPDGVTVEVEDEGDYEPDAIVNCGERVDGGQIAAPNPVVVVEVLSRSTQSVDTGTKLIGYFQVPSVQHYLIVHTKRRAVVHHRRRERGGIATEIVATGRITLDPPGLSVAVEEFYTG